MKQDLEILKQQVEAILKAAFRFRILQKDVLSGSKHTCGLIQRELPHAVIISLRGRHVNGREVNFDLFPLILTFGFPICGQEQVQGRDAKTGNALDP